MRLIRYAILFVFFIMASFAHSMDYIAYRQSDGIMTERGIYSWNCWTPIHYEIHLDVNKNYMTINGKKYEILVPATSWKVYRTFKYTTISCTDDQFGKICVKIIMYDKSKEVRFVIMDEDKAVKISTVDKYQAIRKP